MVLSVLFWKVSVTLTEIIQLHHPNERGIFSLSLIHGKVRGIMSLSLCSLTLQQTRLSVLFHWRLILNQIVLIISPIPIPTGKFFVFTGNLFMYFYYSRSNYYSKYFTFDGKFIELFQSSVNLCHWEFSIAFGSTGNSTILKYNTIQKTDIVSPSHMKTKIVSIVPHKSSPTIN